MIWKIDRELEMTLLYYMVLFVSYPPRRGGFTPLESAAFAAYLSVVFWYPPWVAVPLPLFLLLPIGA